MTEEDEGQAPAQAAAGWYDDGTGTGGQRWWDGTQWTEHRSGPAAPPAPQAGTAAPRANTAPVKKKNAGLKVALGIMAGIFLLGIVGFVGCAVLIGAGVNEAVNDLNDEQAKHAITKAQYNAIQIGMTEQQVRQSTGKAPEDRQAFESEGYLNEEPDKSTCIYYNQADGEFLDTFQLCFDNGKLTSKNDF
ncbi:MAG: DUF2510 domain-containing protein [Thermoleophilia bacterium]|nr:DUF2510 domain-containing protein [Thermoleophilia bacterium]